MIELLAWLGWFVAVITLATWLRGRFAHHRRMELIARACHEVRGPLTAVTLGLHAVRPQSDERETEFMAIDRELRRAGLALADLSLARSGERAQERSVEVDLCELLEHSVAAWQPVARRSQRSVELDLPREPIFTLGRPLRLSQAVGNLIANAIEHGSGRVSVAARPSAAGVRIEVSDDGHGLTEELPQLLVRARRGRGSRGRGLAIVGEIAEGHGGRLVAPPTATGARIAIDLPVVATEVRVMA